MILRKLTVLVACGAGGTVAAVAACDGNNPALPDAPRPDAPGIDATQPTLRGVLSLLEATTVASNGSGGQLMIGTGPILRLSFVDPADAVAPVYDDTGGALAGCRVVEYTPAQYAATLGVDAGTLDVTVGDGGPVFPTCRFLGVPLGYACPEPTTQSAGDNATVGGDLTMLTLTDPDVVYDSNAQGRWLLITGAADPRNDGLFPIAGQTAVDNVWYLNPNAQLGPLGTAATSHVTIAGMGPLPGMNPDPGFIGDDDSFTIAFNSSMPARVPSFTASVTNTADRFALDDFNVGALVALPINGTASAFTIDCGAACGDGIVTVLDIVTTDGLIDPARRYLMPPPVTKAVSVRCATAPVGGGHAVEVPIQVAVYLATSGATRARATYLRAVPVLATTPPAPGGMTIVAGHAIIGFTDATPPP